MYKYNRIITHAGVFHADETLAIATLKKLKVVAEDLEIVRIFQVPEVSDSDIVLDLGRKFNGVNILDHHQDVSLPASCTLALEAFCEDEKMKKYLKKLLFDAVSDHDNGISMPAGSFSNMVKAFNTSSDFETALKYVETTLNAVWCVAESCVAGAEKYVNLEKCGKYRIQENTDVIPNWKELAAEEGVIALVSPNLRGGWQITSFDSEKFNIDVCNTQTFRHNSGFMAVYETKEDCINHLVAIL